MAGQDCIQLRIIFSLNFNSQKYKLRINQSFYSTDHRSYTQEKQKERTNTGNTSNQNNSPNIKVVGAHVQKDKYSGIRYP